MTTNTTPYKEHTMTTNEFDTPTNRYYVKSWGNGWAYEVTCQTTNASFFVQDDAALQLQTDSANFTNEDALAQYIEALGDEGYETEHDFYQQHKRL